MLQLSKQSKAASQQASEISKASNQHNKRKASNAHRVTKESNYSNMYYSNFPQQFRATLEWKCTHYIRAALIPPGHFCLDSLFVTIVVLVVVLL